jgi:azurin
MAIHSTENGKFLERNPIYYSTAISLHIKCHDNMQLDTNKLDVDSCRILRNSTMNSQEKA